MKITMTRRAALSVVVLGASLGIALSACSGESTPEAPASPSTSTSRTPEVTDEALGEALSKLVFQGTQTRSTDGGACLVAAARKAGLSEQAVRFIVESDSDDLGAVAGDMAEVSKNDSGIMLSPGLRKDFDSCVDAQLLPGDGGGDQAYAPPKAGGELPKNKADLTPKYPGKEGETTITSATQLKDGVISTFSSYALNDKQKQVYEAAGECLARGIFDAGFSQETLVLLAGGPPIGADSIADHLPTKADKKIWTSPEFTTMLIDCTDNASPR